MIPAVAGGAGGVLLVHHPGRSRHAAAGVRRSPGHPEAEAQGASSWLRSQILLHLLQPVRLLCASTQWITLCHVNKATAGPMTWLPDECCAQALARTSYLLLTETVRLQQRASPTAGGGAVGAGGCGVRPAAVSGRRTPGAPASCALSCDTLLTVLKTARRVPQLMLQ